MRYAIVFIFSIVIIILIALAGLLLPSKITITKSVLINAPAERIRSQINDFNNWKNWYPAFQNNTISVTRNTLKKNSLQSVSLKDNNGKQIDLDLIVSSNDTIEVAVGSQSSTKVFYQFLLIPHLSGKTQLTLNVNTYFKWYLWEKIKGIFLDKISGPQYESALVRLKEFAEK
jgi:predicted PurR-regulated permease PerM